MDEQPNRLSATSGDATQPGSEPEKKRLLSDPTQGKDSMSKMVRRNLSPSKIAFQFKRLARALKARGVRGVIQIFMLHYGLINPRQFDIPTKDELHQQRKQYIKGMPLFSVVVPLYNTPPKFLHQLVKSVREQTYAKWELLLVNASEQANSEVAEICNSYEKKDGRIRHIRLLNNRGIAANTNVGLRECVGDYVTLVDHDDALSPVALFEVAKATETGADLIYSDEAVVDANLKRVCEFHFKPDYGPDTLRGCNYITHLCAFTKRLLDSVGGEERDAFDGAQDYDLILRLSEKAKKIVHIPKVLYYWRRHENSTAGGISQKPAAADAGRRALAEHLERVDLEGTVRALEDHPGAYSVEYAVWGKPLVSVLIPSCDHIDDLERCLDSLYEKAGWDNLEVLVLDNNSTEKATEPFYQNAEENYPNLRVHRYKGEFNFSAICNFGAQRAKGGHLLLLNNDIEIIREGFIRELLSYSQRPDVGAVGPLLYYPDDTVQHAGLIIGLGGTAGVNHKGHKRGDVGNMFRVGTTQDMSAVTGAALLVKRELYEKLNGLDETNFAVAYNDVDFCLRLREAGYLNVYTPFAVAYHFESKSRGYDMEGEKKIRHDREAANFKHRHAEILKNGDPFYNPHLTLKFENYSMKFDNDSTKG